jgi:hypothetical protein
MLKVMTFRLVSGIGVAVGDGAWLATDGEGGVAIDDENEGELVGVHATTTVRIATRTETLRLGRTGHPRHAATLDDDRVAAHGAARGPAGGSHLGTGVALRSAGSPCYTRPTIQSA